MTLTTGCLWSDVFSPLAVLSLSPSLLPGCFPGGLEQRRDSNDFSSSCSPLSLYFYLERKEKENLDKCENYLNGMEKWGGG